MLKVMTFNINSYSTKHGPWSTRKILIRNAIQDASPDIIALQAVRKEFGVNNGADQATQIAELLPEYRYIIFQPAMHDENGNSGGSAFLSRLNIIEASCLKLTLRPGLEDVNQRVVLTSVLNLKTGPFYLFNAHFSWVYQQASDNVHETLPYINSFTGYALLVGDFNTTPDTDIINRFRKEGWADTWAELCPQDNGYTFESDHLTKRIDYAWANDSLKQRITAVEIVANNYDTGGKRPSDHIGLLVTLAV
ncbi:MAG: hypothetical protein DWB56_05695 [Candidatus Jettenia sp.]|uniref:Endonuclease/exonuclease/phosphatase domain-containing protein n=1 Tax=Candidatus Jettenia caeni TaxID=247490 RepID=I3INP9_9BACT|nr:endonuclease/exonuclease/phosphatase family protein [Candidatus Jettenia sp. AMX1]MBC6928448.1 hypothetical protein [Candidatus Jettenia sp.]NUN24606.1 endonuclease/exonuclease/phosphatase family protein [Candidatus Jettenia caeni]KAA0250436.1 MAG: hypothetical protein EDM77_04855 [Candidatus Jettenia sp. AMX1]MCE7879623.1 hypothetical protein [Candidatus Jettenia sp. AMX1]MCQ3926491.1 hypothetical protein [Candidatus Jettenia sp.]